MTERDLLLSHVPPRARAGVAALLASDTRLGDVLRGVRDPMRAQLRLTWWYEALAELDTSPPPQEPLLQTLAAHVLPRVAGGLLAEQVVGWDALLEEPLTSAAVLRHARERGGRLFAGLGALLGTSEPRLRAAGEGWALADVARHLSSPVLSRDVRRLAAVRLQEVFASPWPREARGAGVLAVLARADLATRPRPPGHPARAARLLWHRLSGR